MIRKAQKCGNAKIFALNPMFPFMSLNEGFSSRVIPKNERVLFKDCQKNERVLKINDIFS